MTIGRAHLVDPSVSRWYDCVTRCVQRAFVLGEGLSDRKLWIENRLQELAQFGCLGRYDRALTCVSDAPPRCRQPAAAVRNRERIN